MKSVSVSDFFPVQDDEMMERYLKKDDDYEERKKQLYTVIYNARVADTKKKFGIWVMKAIFHPDYIFNHRWPTSK